MSFHPAHRLLKNQHYILQTRDGNCLFSFRQMAFAQRANKMPNAIHPINRRRCRRSSSTWATREHNHHPPSDIYILRSEKPATNQREFTRDIRKVHITKWVVLQKNTSSPIMVYSPLNHPWVRASKRATEQTAGERVTSHINSGLKCVATRPTSMLLLYVLFIYTIFAPGRSAPFPLGAC